MIFAGGYFVAALSQSKTTKQQVAGVKLPYSSEDFEKIYPHRFEIPPVVLANNRLLVPVGDILYMLDAEQRILWTYSVEPNVIYDARVDTRGRIYVAISDGLFKVLDTNGKEIWGHFMNGRAQYSQIAPYNKGLLVVVDMEGYRREDDPPSDDKIEYFENGKRLWSKDFPQKARLEVSSERILAVKQTKDGKEIAEIR